MSKDNKRQNSMKTRLENIKNIINTTNLSGANPLHGLNENMDTINYYCGISEGDDDTRNSKTVLGKKKLNFNKVMSKLDAKLVYLKGGANGIVFYCFCKSMNKELSVKVVPYLNRREYGNETNIQRPENSEILMLKTLSYFIIKSKTPHLILPILTFDTDIKTFLKLKDANIIPKNDKSYDRFLENYKNGVYKNTVSVVISEWANKGDLGTFLKNNYTKLKLIEWKCIFFQLISVLAIIQTKFPNFRHNDLKANNVLVSSYDLEYPSQYSINNKFYILPSIGYRIFLWDFDFACINGVVENIKVYEKWTNDVNINNKQNKYYDIHYFFCTLCNGFIPNLLQKNEVYPEVKDFINYVVPNELMTIPKENKDKKTFDENNYKVNPKCRLLADIELHTPVELLEHSFFDCFKCKK